MLSGAVLKQFRTYLKSQVGHGWSVEGRKSKGRLLTRVSFRYLSGERSVVLLDIDFDAENQDDIVRTVKKLSDLMRERNIELSKAKELLCGGKIDAHGKASINWKSLQDEFINVERGDRRKTTLNGLKKVNTGFFQITVPNSTRVSSWGSYDTSTIKKDILL